MSYEEIKKRHDSCVKKGTRHNAHADRGELLEIVKELKAQLDKKRAKPLKVSKTGNTLPSFVDSLSIDD